MKFLWAGMTNNRLSTKQFVCSLICEQTCSHWRAIMKTLLTAATLAAMSLAAAPMTAGAADSSHAALDACVKVLVAKLGEQNGKVPMVRETRYPEGAFTPGDNLEFTMFVADTRASDRPVVRASCTVTPAGRVLSLEKEWLRRM
jgi:hypothetical protein